MVLEVRLGAHERLGTGCEESAAFVALHTVGAPSNNGSTERLVLALQHLRLFAAGGMLEAARTTWRDHPANIAIGNNTNFISQSEIALKP